MTQDEHARQLLRGGSPRHWPWADPQQELRRRRTLPSTLLVGDAHGVAALRRQHLRRPPRDFEVIGCCLTTPGSPREPVEGLPVLGGPGDVVDVVCHHAVDTVAVLPSTSAVGLRRLERQLRDTRADLLLAPAIPGAGTSSSRVPSAGRRGAAWSGRSGLHGVRAVIKAAFDRGAAALILVLLLPVLLGIAVAVKATTRGPVLVRLPRLGRHGRLFRLLRFSASEDTLLGPVLRRHSLDELPQLLNVLRGDMSLVGPRPGLPSETAGAEHRLRPGLIGLTPVGGRPGRSAEDDGMPIDVHYSENWTLLLDLAILRKSFAAALRGGRAA
ncbi:MAG: sugar transferase [Actinomycetes bacterium]